jgi:hypothetical protein
VAVHSGSSTGLKLGVSLTLRFRNFFRDAVVLNADLREELERRLTVIAREREGDPGARDLPRGDLVWLLALLAAACFAVPLMQTL